jgi:hypothetical protein
MLGHCQFTQYRKGGGRTPEPPLGWYGVVWVFWISWGPMISTATCMGYPAFTGVRIRLAYAITRSGTSTCSWDNTAPIQYHLQQCPGWKVWDNPGMKWDQSLSEIFKSPLAMIRPLEGGMLPVAVCGDSQETLDLSLGCWNWPLCYFIGLCMVCCDSFMRHCDTVCPRKFTTVLGFHWLQLDSHLPESVEYHSQVLQMFL